MDRKWQALCALVCVLFLQVGAENLNQHPKYEVNMEQSHDNTLEILLLDSTYCNFTFEPTKVSDFYEGQHLNVTFNTTCFSNETRFYTLQIVDRNIVEFVDNQVQEGSIEPNVINYGSFQLSGENFGRTNIKITVTNQNNVIIPTYPSHYEVSVLRKDDILSFVFIIILGVMIVLYNIGFGCKVKREHILEILKKPIGPAIGFFCQFLCMAPLAFGIAKLLDLDPVSGLGLLAMGSCPGGGGSNVFAYLLDADLELSITMSFISTLAALGMTPMWLWALGRYFQGSDSRVFIPVTNVFASLAVVAIPVVVGVFISYWKPAVGKKISWCLKPFTGLIGIVFGVMGTVVYWYALIRVTPRTVAACALLPFCGYLLGLSIGLLCRQGAKKSITISLETGFQNLALSLMMLKISLPVPEADIAGVIPIFYTFMSAIFPILGYLFKFFKDRYEKAKGLTKEAIITSEAEENSIDQSFSRTNEDTSKGVSNGHVENQEDKLVV